MLSPSGLDRSSETYVPRTLRPQDGPVPQQLVTPPAGRGYAVDPLQPGSLRVTIVLIGPPGDGKSTLGNLLVRDAGSTMAAPFRASEDFNSVGAEVAHADFQYENVHHRIIDTCGLFEGATNAADRLASCAGLSPGGIDAFVFVIRKGRFTEEYFDQLRCFEEAAGTGALSRTLIVFSHCGRETNEQLVSRCRKSGNSHLREALQRTAGIVGVDCHTPSRSADDRMAVLAATARICREHRDVPKLAPMAPAELRRQLAEMDSAIGGLSHERQDMMKVKMDGVRSGVASLAAVRKALGEAREQQTAEDTRIQESRALQDSVWAARHEAKGLKQAATSLEQGRHTPPGAFACCTPVAACPGACDACDVGVKEVVKDWQADRQQNIRNKFAEADYIADLNQQLR